jgi:hypothetical protein
LPSGQNFPAGNCLISNQGGSISSAKISIINVRGEKIYESPADPDCGEFVGSYDDGQGFNWKENVYAWPAERRVDLPASGAPYTVSATGEAHYGWSVNYQASAGVVLITEYGAQ